MMRNAKAKGRRNESRSRKLLEASGYAVTRAAASLGMWDLVGVSATDALLVQVKTRDWFGTAEMETLQAFRGAGKLPQAGASVAASHERA